MEDNERDLLEVLGRVEVWKGCEIHYEPVKGGITNPNWKVSVDGASYFVKVPGRGTEAFIDRKAAHVASLIAAELRIGPKIFLFFEDSGVEIFEWLHGYRKLNFGDVFNQTLFYKMVDNISTFHNYRGGSLPRTQTPFEQTRDFISLAKEQGTYLPPEMARMQWLSETIEAAVMAEGIDLVPCHNDFWTPNYLYREETGDLKLVDFEYAAMSDACWDFADIATANYFTEAMDVEWIRAYYGEFDERKFARLKLYKLLKDIGWSMWALVQAKQSSVSDFDYFEFFGTKMARLRTYWNDSRLDYWLSLLQGNSGF